MKILDCSEIDLVAGGGFRGFSADCIRGAQAGALTGAITSSKTSNFWSFLGLFAGNVAIGAYGGGCLDDMKTSNTGVGDVYYHGYSSYSDSCW